MSGVISDDAFVRLFQRKAGLTVDGWAGPDTLGVLDQLVPSSTPSATELPEDYWPTLERIESGGRPYVKAPTSSASGLYQFIQSTWLGEGGEWGPDMTKAFGGLRPEPDEQLRRAKSFTAKNADYLREEGVPINSATLYAAHFLGAVTAREVLAADVDEDAGELAGRAAAQANPSILLGKTVGEFISWLHEKTGTWAK